VERTLSGAAGGGAAIDYDRLAAALARQPITITMDRRAVGALMRTDNRAFAAASPTNGVGGR
jgi:hypothetical protein